VSDTPYVIHVMVHDKRLIDTIFNELADLVADVANDRADVFGTSIQCSMEAHACASVDKHKSSNI